MSRRILALSIAIAVALLVRPAAGDEPTPIPLAAPRLVPVSPGDAPPPRSAPVYKSALFWSSIVVGAVVVGAITWGAVWAATREPRYAVVEF